MAEETQVSHAERGPRKRKIGKKKGSKAKKKLRVGEMKPKKIDRKMKKLFRKRARQYNSDEDSAPEGEAEYELEPQIEEEEQDGGNSSEEAGEDENQELGDANVDDESLEYHEDGTIQPGITKFTEGCRAFNMAYKSIFKKTVHDDDTLGPVLAPHKKLIIEKLADEVEDRKAKGVARKEKHLVAEKGHVKPETYLDSHEKFLIGVATKGVVKLFNAVNKAQNAQKGLNPSRSKDAKVLTKKRKQAFFSELGKTSTASTSASKSSNSQGDGEEPGWAPLRDNYMLSNSKLKDWDRMPEPAVTDDIGRGSGDISSDDD